MQDVTLVGIDLGKHSFHLHGQDRHGKAVFRKKVSRKQLTEVVGQPDPMAGYRLLTVTVTRNSNREG